MLYKPFGIIIVCCDDRVNVDEEDHQEATERKENQ
jgi:hypothetical protein